MLYLWFCNLTIQTAIYVFLSHFYSPIISHILTLFSSPSHLLFEIISFWKQAIPFPFNTRYPYLRIQARSTEGTNESWSGLTRDDQTRAAGQDRPAEDRCRIHLYGFGCYTKVSAAYIYATSQHICNTTKPHTGDADCKGVVADNACGLQKFRSHLSPKRPGE